MKSEDLPKLPLKNLDRPNRRIEEMKTGEECVVFASMAVKVDNDLHVWLDGNEMVLEGGPLSRLTVKVQRVEYGFILWLDSETTFKPQAGSPAKQWIPVVEIRDAEEER